MNEKDTVTIPRDEYDALIAIENNTRTLERLARKNGYMNIDDALVILGFEPIEEEKDAGKQNGD